MKKLIAGIVIIAVIVSLAHLLTLKTHAQIRCKFCGAKAERINGQISNIDNSMTPKQLQIKHKHYWCLDGKIKRESILVKEDKDVHGILYAIALARIWDEMEINFPDPKNSEALKVFYQKFFKMISSHNPSMNKSKHIGKIIMELPLELSKKEVQTDFPKFLDSLLIKIEEILKQGYGS